MFRLGYWLLLSNIAHHISYVVILLSLSLVTVRRPELKSWLIDWLIDFKCDRLTDTVALYCRVYKSWLIAGTEED